MPTNTTGPLKDVSKEVKYLNKDFEGFRNDLIEFAKSYFPNTYTDFNESSPGMMFIEMAAYIGDVLSYYVDNQFKESILAYAEEKRTVYNIAQSLGYKPKVSYPATTVLDVFQTVPATGAGDSTRPNMNYALTVTNATKVKSETTGKTFRFMDNVNFKYSSSFDPTTVSIFETDSNVPTKYLLKKRVRAISGDVKEELVTFTSAVQYDKIVLGNPNVIEIISCIDSDGNNWYEVPFLAQDTIFDEVENTSANDSELTQFNDTAPYLLKLRKTPRRFTTFIRDDNRTELRFGAGVSDNPDEEIVPNPDRVGSSLASGVSKLDTAFDPANFLNTRTYGLAPANTTLTIKYTVGGGIEDNVPANDIKNLNDVTFDIDETNLVAATVQDAKDSVAVNNPDPAAGGRSGESLVEVKNNALAYFQAQSRAVTKEDYMIRALSLPQRFGNIAKVYIVQDEQLNQSEEDVMDNEGAAAPPLEEQIENINPLVQEAADLKTAKAEAKVESAAKVREKIAKARMTAPKSSESEPDVSFGGSGASATNPRGRGGY
jgi:hypothetical protein